jgi:ribosomal protein S18 acetylase RimI-like enzyme
LRAATLADAESIALLHVDSWRRTYRGMMTDDFLDGAALDNRHRVWRERLTSPLANQFVSVAEDRSTIVGFICGFGGHDPAWGSYIDNLHVVSTHHRQGIGRTLMRESGKWFGLEYADIGVWLWVMEANANARAFYEQLGAANAGTTDLTDPGGGHAPNCRYVWPRPDALL